MSVPEPAVSPPMAVICELTHRCPLSCPYCSNPIELVKKGAELSTEAWLSVLDQVADIGVLQAHFTGGEPTARSDLEAMVERAEARGLYTNLITAAVTLTRERLARLVDLGLQHVQISFQASEPKLADHVGGFAGGARQEDRGGRLGPGPRHSSHRERGDAPREHGPGRSHDCPRARTRSASGWRSLMCNTTVGACTIAASFFLPELSSTT